MGEKDFQQLYLVRKFLEKNYETKIISCNTIRDNNKVALSSRNYLLSKYNLNIAGLIAKQLFRLKSRINRNKRKSNYLIKNIKKELTEKFNIKIEYLEARNVINLKSNISKNKFKLFVAYHIENIRLIDNF